MKQARKQSISISITARLTTRRWSVKLIQNSVRNGKKSRDKTELKYMARTAISYCIWMFAYSQSFSGSHGVSRQKYSNIIYDILHRRTTDDKTFNQSKKIYTRHLNNEYSPCAAAQLKQMCAQKTPKVGIIVHLMKEAGSIFHG